MAQSAADNSRAFNGHDALAACVEKFRPPHHRIDMKVSRGSFVDVTGKLTVVRLLPKSQTNGHASLVMVLPDPDDSWTFVVRARAKGPGTEFKEFYRGRDMDTVLDVAIIHASVVY